MGFSLVVGFDGTHSLATLGIFKSNVFWGGGLKFVVFVWRGFRSQEGF